MFTPDTPATRQAFNRLAREKMKLRLLADIRMDLMVCELEGWGKLEYLDELLALVLSLDIEGMVPLMPAHITEAEQAAYQYISSVYDSLERDTPIQYFYTAYTKWCMEQNLLPLTKHGVTKVLKKYFPVATVATSYYENGTRVMGCCRCYRKMGR